MGFSSFGGQTRPNKKRRYNPHADNVVGRPGPTFTSFSAANMEPISSNTHGTEPLEPAPASSLPMHLPPKPPTAAADSYAPDLPQSLDQGHDFQGHHRGGRGGRGGRHRGRGRGEGDEESQGPRNDKWYLDYYDPMSNENPWTELEKQMGLPTKGTWLEKGHKVA